MRRKRSFLGGRELCMWSGCFRNSFLKTVEGQKGRFVDLCTSFVEARFPLAKSKCCKCLKKFAVPRAVDAASTVVQDDVEAYIEHCS